MCFFQGEKTEWIMPKELNEISGISFVDDHTLACVQDEKGIIFIYDLQKSEIVKRIPFAGKGDYEGITLVGTNAFVVAGNGVLYEINNYLTEPDVQTYSLELLPKEESEAVCYDAEGNRLLLAFKNRKKDDVDPELFAFDLTQKKLLDSAVIKVHLKSSVFRKKDRDNAKRLWEPADLAIDPLNKNIIVVDAINCHLLKLSAEGNLLQLEAIDHKKMHHPEGVAISPEGVVYICNDANNEGKGKIMALKNAFN
jgi:uncharacterized protein YjiK